jgi:hypothetical protein
MAVCCRSLIYGGFNREAAKDRMAGNSHPIPEAMADFFERVLGLRFDRRPHLSAEVARELQLQRRLPGGVLERRARRTERSIAEPSR